MICEQVKIKQGELFTLPTFPAGLLLCNNCHRHTKQRPQNAYITSIACLKIYNELL